MNAAQNHQAILSLGSNLGDRKGFLQSGLEGLAATCGQILKQSALYESAVWGATAQADYLNLALLLETVLSPEDLLRACQKIEAARGRTRETKWAARTLDIDILFYDDVVVQLPHLSIPHPLLTERRFVLEPLAEISPHWRHPQREQTIEALLAQCRDAGWVRLWKTP